MGFRLTPSGGWAALADVVEDRALPAPTVQPTLPAYSRSAPLNITAANALRVSDAYAAVRVWRTRSARFPSTSTDAPSRGACPRVRAAAPCNSWAAPHRARRASTSSPRCSSTSTSTATRSSASTAPTARSLKLGLISPDSVEVELRGQRIVYTLDTAKGRVEVGPEDVLHIKGMSLDGLRGLSPVAQCRIALGLSSAMQESARQYFEQGSRPTGILTVQGVNAQHELRDLAEDWRNLHGGVQNMHKVAVVSGDLKFTPIAF